MTHAPAPSPSAQLIAEARIPRILSLLLAGLLLAAPFALAPAAQAATGTPIDIVKIHFDPIGKDAANNAGWNQEYIVVKNSSKSTVTLTGYRITDNGPQSFTFPKGLKLGAGKSLTIRSGTGKNTASTLYWGKKSYIWNNDGDSARVLNASGRQLEKCTYTWKPSTKVAGTKTC